MSTLQILANQGKDRVHKGLADIKMAQLTNRGSINMHTICRMRWFFSSLTKM